MAYVHTNQTVIELCDFGWVCVFNFNMMVKTVLFQLDFVRIEPETDNNT